MIKYFFLILAFLFFYCFVAFAQNGFTLESDTSNFEYKVFYFSDEGQIIKIPELFLNGLDDKDTNTIVASNETYAAYSYWDWNTDRQDIYILDLKSNNKRLLIENEDYNYYLQDISPNSNNILFTRYQNDYTGLCFSKTDGTGFNEVIGTQQGYFSLALWLSDTEILYSIRTDEKNELYILNINNMESQFVNDSFGGLGDLSNDGKLIFNEENGNKMDGYIDLYSGSITYFTLDPYDYHGYKWSPDSSQVICISDDKFNEAFYLMDVNTQNTTKILRVYDITNESLGWFDHGNKIVFASNMNDYGLGTISIIDINTFKTVNFTANENVYYMIAKACPLLSVFNGTTFSKVGEILTSHIKEANERTEQIVLSGANIVDNRLTIRIEEVLSEITYLDKVNIIINNNVYMSVDYLPELEYVDNKYIELHKDESLRLEFIINEITDNNIILEVTGYYFPFF